MKTFVIYKLQAMGQTDFGAVELESYSDRVDSCIEIGISIIKVKEVEANSREEALLLNN